MTQHEPQLHGQTVVLIGGSAGIGLETARLARSEGADVILPGRNPERLEQAARDVDARSTAAFDATDAAALKRFFAALPAPIDHVLITGPGPRYVPLLEMDAGDVGEALGDHVVLGLEVARDAAPKMRPGGTRPGAKSSARRSHRTRGRPGRRRRARRAPHDQHRLTGATYDIDGGQQFVAR